MFVVSHIKQQKHLPFPLLAIQPWVKLPAISLQTSIPIQGLSCVVTQLLEGKQAHPLVVIVNLREDAVIECNGATYTWREPEALEEPIVMPGVSAREVEALEDALKTTVKERATFQVRA